MVKEFYAQRTFAVEIAALTGELIAHLISRTQLAYLWKIINQIQLLHVNKNILVCRTGVKLITGYTYLECGGERCVSDFWNLKQQLKRQHNMLPLLHLNNSIATNFNSGALVCLKEHETSLTTRCCDLRWY